MSEQSGNRMRDRSPKRRLVVLSLGLLALALSMALNGSVASASSLGTALARPFECGTLSTGRVVQAYPPFMSSVTGNWETVQWAVNLYRWDGTKWAVFANKPNQMYWNGSAWVQYPTWQMYAAGTNASGTFIANWTLYGAPIWSPVTFGNLPSGYYAVQNYYLWVTGGIVSAWVPYSAGGAYCQLN